VFDVDVEDPFEQSGPTHARRFSLTLGVIGRGLGGTLCRSGNDFTAQLRVGRQYAVEEQSGVRALHGATEKWLSSSEWVVRCNCNAFCMNSPASTTASIDRIATSVQPSGMVPMSGFAPTDVRPSTAGCGRVRLRCKLEQDLV
jgi:hypothetical protein